MSYDNNSNLTEYFSTVVEMEKLLETIPLPTTKEALASASAWGARKCLDEMRIQLTILRRTLQDVELERQQQEKEQ